MMKGVNKQIVEINHTDNDYFEKAILYVKPDKINFTKQELSHEAEQYLNSLGFRKKDSKLSWIISISGICIGVGAFIAAAVVYF